ncbi:MAG TPA: septal ring lytic transglycosylase RlpA family protein, partial [Thermoanaerobaculia bacterium]|nr:septal ring lytic transglycosylase RlpA family protein [Thermoanaerobaculia bacterium]
MAGLALVGYTGLVVATGSPAESQMQDTSLRTVLPEDDAPGLPGTMGSRPLRDRDGRVMGAAARGWASWYGPELHGEPTASGEPFDMHALTAAHRTLPLGSYAEVRNLTNGKTVMVRINDRGPFPAERVIDLSHAAAGKIDMLKSGSALVEVVPLEGLIPLGAPASCRPLT